MRALFTAILITLGITSTFSQSYIRMIDTNSVWDILCGGITTNGVDLRQTDVLQFIGDTIINDTTYHKLFAHQYITTTDSSLQYIASFREDTSLQRVYIRDYDGYTKEFLIYDFSLIPGDSVIFYRPINDVMMPVRVDSVKIINFAGQNRRLFYISEFEYVVGSWQPTPCQWIEGIGRVNRFNKITGPFEYYQSLIDELLCFNHGTQLLYQNTTYFSCKIVHVGIKEIEQFAHINIYPNPAMDEVNIEIESPLRENEISIMSLTGHEVIKLKSYKSLMKIDISTLASGLYILRVKDKDSVTTMKFAKE